MSKHFIQGDSSHLREEDKAQGRLAAARRKQFDIAISLARLSGNYGREYTSLPDDVKAEYSFRTFERMAKS